MTPRALAVILLAALIIGFALARGLGNRPRAAGTGSGVAATQTRSLPPFAGVDLAGANNVTMRIGARQSVTVHADSNLLGRVTTQVRAGSLVIGTTPGPLSARSPMFVAVTVPSIDRLALSGHGNISVAGINSQSIAVDLSGSGTVSATGTTGRLDVTIGGSGTALLGGLVARDATAALSGHGTITLTAMDSLNATVSGNGAIVYGGNPTQVTKVVTGSGTISGG
jgi:Putative auto-transporter adhesin, head GIN domain